MLSDVADITALAQAAVGAGAFAYSKLHHPHSDAKDGGGHDQPRPTEGQDDPQHASADGNQSGGESGG